jgi:hypothetical protein
MPKIYIYNRTKAGDSRGYVLKLNAGPQGKASTESTLAIDKSVSVDPTSYPFIIRAEAKFMPGVGGLATPSNYLQQAKPNKDIHLIVTSRDAGANNIGVQINSVDAAPVPSVN